MSHDKKSMWGINSAYHDSYIIGDSYGLPVRAYDPRSPLTSSDVARHPSSGTDQQTDKTDDDSIVFERGIPQSLLSSPPQETSDYSVKLSYSQAGAIVNIDQSNQVTNQQQLDHISERLSKRMNFPIASLRNAELTTLIVTFNAHKSEATINSRDKELLDNFLKKAERRSIRVALPSGNIEPMRFEPTLSKIPETLPVVPQNRQPSPPEFGSSYSEQSSFDVNAFHYIPNTDLPTISDKSRFLRFNNIPALMNTMAINNICGVK